MKYFVIDKSNGKTEEIPKEKAMEILEGWWNQPLIQDIFTHNKLFKLYTPFSVIYSENKGKSLTEYGTEE